MSMHELIENKLQDAFALQYLEVVNESHQHNVPANSETHFKVTMVSPDFDGKRMVARHQLAYQVLNEALQGSVHALALHMYTPEEWEKKSGAAPLSPACMGGSKKD